MEKLLIKDDFIKLWQALKLCGIAQSGIDAKMMILDGEVKYNGQVELQRGKKLYEGDTFEADGRVFQIVK
jgi:ribosome-associated protein